MFSTLVAITGVGQRQLVVCIGNNRRSDRILASLHSEDLASVSKGNDSRQSGLVCSFCGTSQEEVRKLIAGPGVYICVQCIDLCNDII